MESNTKDLSKEKQAQPSADETVSELVHRHLKDENHVVTDEEIRNAKLEVYNLEEPQGDLIDTKDNAAKEKEIATPKEKDILVTPLDVLK
ncbi:MAG: hypothetical protein LH478_01800 [Chitinophagaceae bacterium]|nr:hypothetical protein [Chitinophagaceae bacterium]